MRLTVEFGCGKCGKSCAKIMHIGKYLWILTGIHSLCSHAQLSSSVAGSGIGFLQRRRHELPQGPDVRRSMDRERTSQQSAGSRGIVQRQTVDRRIDQYLTLAFNPFYRFKVRPAPATHVSAVERGTAKRTALHRSRL